MSSIEKLLNGHNVRPAAMRILIYKFMAKKERAVAMTEIEKTFLKSDRATLSRTIKKFETTGIVHQIDDSTGIPKYALCESGCNCEIDQDLHIIFVVPIVMKPFV